MKNILDFGALADGKTVCTKAIQAAIDACAEDGGGTVIVPAGRFITGTLWLKSHVELHLEMGALLKGSLNLDDYCNVDSYEQNCICASEQWNGAHLIVVLEQEDVALTGPGTIDGSGEFFFEDEAPPRVRRSFAWHSGMKLARDKERLRPGQMIVFCESSNVRITDLNLRNSPCWTVFLHGCSDVMVRGLNIRNPQDNGNTDGIDIDCCDGVTVSDCIITTGDDAITLRGSNKRLKDKSRACQNVAISNCVLSSSVCGFRIGVGQGEIRHAVISNIMMKRTGTGFLFQSAYTVPSKGVDITDVSISNIQMHCVANPVHIATGAPSATAQIRNINIQGIYGRCHGSCNFTGNELSHPKHISIRDVDLTIEDSPVKLDDLSYYPMEFLKFDKVDDLTLDNVRITWAENAFSTYKCIMKSTDAQVNILPNCILPEPNSPRP